MCCNVFPNPEIDLPHAFADFFMSKTTNIVNKTIVDNYKYNGKRKLNVDNDDFM